jgi:hypothetical protein
MAVRSGAPLAGVLLAGRELGFSLFQILIQYHWLEHQQYEYHALVLC